MFLSAFLIFIRLFAFFAFAWLCFFLLLLLFGAFCAFWYYLVPCILLVPCMLFVGVKSYHIKNRNLKLS